MGSITASTLISDFRHFLQDSVSPYRYDDATVLRYLNRTQMMIYNLNPPISTTRESVRLLAGSLQNWPVPDAPMFTVTRNMGDDGSTPGREITLVSRMWLTAALGQELEAAPASDTVIHYMMDTDPPLDRQHYWVYPPMVAPPGYVEVMYPVPPANLVLVTNAITVDNRFGIAIPHGMAYLALLEDTPNESNLGMATQHYGLFMAAIGAKAPTE